MASSLLERRAGKIDEKEAAKGKRKRRAGVGKTERERGGEDIKTGMGERKANEKRGGRDRRRTKKKKTREREGIGGGRETGKDAKRLAKK